MMEVELKLGYLTPESVVLTTTTLAQPNALDLKDAHKYLLG